MKGDLQLIDIIIRILIAMIAGGIVGLDRSLKNRPAGMRTHMLVCIGACLIMITNQYVYNIFENVEPTRMGAQVVSGIGFLGAGTIMISYNRKITGLTTAASLWASAAIGLAAGIGFYEGAIVGGIAVFIAISLLYTIDDRLSRKRKHADIYVELNDGYKLGDFINIIHEEGIKISHVQLEKNNTKSKYTTTFVATLESSNEMDIEKVEHMMNDLDEVGFFDIL